VFRRFDPALKLTATSAPLRTIWDLPAWFLPGERPSLTYHRDARRWGAVTGNRVTLRAASRGQEFVLDADAYPEAIPWAARLIGSLG